MSFEKRPTSTPRSQGLDIDTKTRDQYQPGDRVFLKPTGHAGEIQVTLATVAGNEMAGQVSGYMPPLATAAEPAACDWGSPQSFTKDEVQHHEYGA